MERYEIEAAAAAKLMAMIEERGLDGPYYEGVKDALGWVLGHYEAPAGLEAAR